MANKKNNTRYFKPGITDGRFFLKRTATDEDGNDQHVPDFEIGPSGVAVSDSDLLEDLDNHPLKGRTVGFYEVETLARPKVVANQAADEESETIPSDEQPAGESNNINDLSIPEAEAYIEENHLSDEQIVGFTEGDTEERTGIAEIRKAAQKRLEESEEAAEEPEPAEQQVVVKDEITNINQLKDYIQDQPGVDGRKLTTGEKILAAAKQLDPPHEFPNLNAGG